MESESVWSRQVRGLGVGVTKDWEEGGGSGGRSLMDLHRDKLDLDPEYSGSPQGQEALERFCRMCILGRS